MTIESALQVGADGQILGFGRARATANAGIIELFPSNAPSPDEDAFVALFRRGLALTLGPWTLLRPRVVVQCGEGVEASSTLLERALRAAGASEVAVLGSGV